jgi:hypothetical protein
MLIAILASSRLSSVATSTLGTITTQTKFNVRDDMSFTKGEFVPVHAMKADRGSTFTIPLVLNLGTRWT